MLGAVKLGLQLLPFRTVYRFVLRRRMRAVGVDQKIARSSIEKVAWAVTLVSHYLPVFRNCLNRALAAQMLLKRRGHSANLHIGVMRGQEGKFEAHAWIESEGQVIIGSLPELSTYSRLPSLEGRGL